MRVNKLGDPLVLAYVIDGFGLPLYSARQILGERVEP